MHRQLLFLSVLLAVGGTAQAQWATQPINFANPNAAPALIEAVSPAVVWTIGYDYSGGEDSNLVGLSTNGGAAWTTSTVTGVNNSSEFVSSLSAVSNTTAWVTVVGDRANGRVMKTTDGGQTWVRQTTAAQFGSTAGYPGIIHFFNANDGVVLGDPPVDGGPFEVYTTANGGATWTAAPSPPVSNSREDSYDDCYAVVGNTIWCGTYQGRVLRSTDKGLTWTAANTSLNNVRNLAFRDAQNGLAIFLDEDRGERRLERTIDGGLTWTRVAYMGVLPGFGLDNVPGTSQYVSTGLDLGDGIKGTAYSRDNGQTWVTVENSNDNLYVDFVSPTAGWTGGISTTTGAGQGMRRFTSSVLGNRLATPEQLGYSVSPNPSTDGRFEVRAQDVRPGVMLRVSDALGREVTRRPWAGSGASPCTLDLSQYQAGVYMLEINSAAGTAHQKLVVQ